MLDLPRRCACYVAWQRDRPSLDLSRKRIGAKSDDSANDGRREAELDEGKRRSRCMDDEANDQPNDRPDHAYRSRADDRPPPRQRQVT